MNDDNIIDEIVAELKEVAKEIKQEKKKKKKGKYTKWIGDDDYRSYDVPDYVPDPVDFSYSSLSTQEWESNDEYDIPKELLLDLQSEPGFFFGKKKYDESAHYVGLPQNEESNILVVGGSGSGKSSGIAKPTLQTFQGAICATDIKGELSEFYADLYKKGLVKRPYIIFDPMDEDAFGYDPFQFLHQDGEENLVNNIQDFVNALHPLSQEEAHPFWVKTEQAVLAASLISHFKQESSFSNAVLNIASSDVDSICKEIAENNGKLERMFLGQLCDMNPENLAEFDRGIRNAIIPFATDKHLLDAFDTDNGKKQFFSWSDLDEYNIFIRIPEGKLEQWGSAITLMYAQLLHFLQNRPDKFSPEGASIIPTLLLMDEFANFGKLEYIVHAISTLRSRNVNIALFIQSLAQLDKFYGTNDRRILLDNCRFKILLNAGDPETQQFLSMVVGKSKQRLRSASENLDEFHDTSGYSKTLSESWECRIQPHEFAELTDIILNTPKGTFRIDKVELHDEPLLPKPVSNTQEPPTIYVEVFPAEEIDCGDNVIYATAYPAEYFEEEQNVTN